MSLVVPCAVIRVTTEKESIMQDELSSSLQVYPGRSRNGSMMVTLIAWLFQDAVDPQRDLEILQGKMYVSLFCLIRPESS